MLPLGDETSTLLQRHVTAFDHEPGPRALKKVQTHALNDVPMPHSWWRFNGRNPSLALRLTVSLDPVPKVKRVGSVWSRSCLIGSLRSIA
jgi:hypothetical protein